MRDVSEYGKIVDTIMWLDRHHSLKFCTILNKMIDGNLTNWYSEVEFRKDGVLTANVNRNLDYYFKIDQVDIPIKEFIILPITVVPMFIQALDQATLWFTGREYEGLFARTANGDICVTQDIPPITVSLPKDITLSITPDIIIQRLNGCQRCVKIDYGSNHIMLEMSRLYALLYALKGFNMPFYAHTAAASLGRPKELKQLYTINKPQQSTEPATPQVNRNRTLADMRKNKKK